MDQTIQFRTGTYESTITRPANTNTYAVGDVFSGAGNEIFVLGLPWDQNGQSNQADESVVRQSSVTNSLSLNAIKLITPNNPALNLAGDLWFFSREPGSQVDAAPASFTEEELDYWLLTVPIAAADWIVADSGTDAAGIQVWQKRNIDLPEQFPALNNLTTGQVFAVLVVSNEYAPASGQTIKLKATFTRD
jgi:hypothetical protein